MDEIEYKLRTNNSVFIVNAIDKLITTVKSKYKPAERKKFVIENEELKFLREKCSSENRLVSLTACQGLLALVELGVLEIGHTMSTVVTLLPSAHNYSAIISTMAGLLILDLRSRLVPGQPYMCQFSLRSPQHPFITVMEKNRDAEDEVLAQMHALCTHPDYVVSSNALELLRPVLMWLTCNPERHSIKPWRLLLSLPQTPALTDILVQCLSCQQIRNSDRVEHAFAAYLAVTESAVYQQNRELVTALVPMLARISNQLVIHGFDPRSCYNLLERCFAMDAAQLRSNAGLTVMLLADNLKTTPAAYLHELFNLCLNIISKYDYSLVCLNVFVALSLQWLHLPSHLTSAALKVAAKIVDTQRNDPKDDVRFHTANLKSNRMFKTLLYTDSRLSIVFKLNQTWERIRDNPDKLANWLSSFESVDDIVKLELGPFLMGMTLLNRKEAWWEDVCCKALNILIGLVNAKKEISVEILPLLLYKIANDKCPRVRWQCLKALPLMAVTKENVPTIVSVLKQLKANKTVPTSFLIMLYTRLAESQVRCFPYLQEILTESVTTRPDEHKAEVEIARAFSVLRICQLRPTTHGVELVGVLSGILNRCTDKTVAVAARAALLALAELWKGSGVAAAAAWRAVGARLATDHRVPVLHGVCSLLSVVPSLRSSSVEFTWLSSACAQLLWRLLATADLEIVKEAALALQHYRIDDYTLKDIPEIYRRAVKLPASHCKTPADAARDPADVLDYVPCEIWPEVFKYTNQAALPSVEIFVWKLCEREIKSYRSGVYQVEGGREPQTLGHLPPHSVVRGLMEFLKKQATQPSYDCPGAALLSMVRCVCREAGRALPALDACFLHELLAAGGETRRAAAALAAKQATTTMSAKRLVENYLQALSENAQEEDIVHFFELLPTLCRTMPPNSIRPVLEKFIGDAYNEVVDIKAADLGVKGSKAKDTEAEVNEEEEYLFVRMWRYIGNCLETERIHDANRTLLTQIVENYFDVISIDNVSWRQYAQLWRLLDSGALERVTSPKSWWEPNAIRLRKATCARAAAATTRGLPCVNEALDAALQLVTEQENCLRTIVRPLKIAKVDEKSTVEWFLQLMARTQVAFTETSNQPSRLYLCSIFFVSAAIFSQLFVLHPDDSDISIVQMSLAGEMLPICIAELVKRDSWKHCTMQILEWLRHTRDSIKDTSTSLSCHRALLALRDTEPFVRHKTWITLDKHFSKTSLSTSE